MEEINLREKKLSLWKKIKTSSRFQKKGDKQIKMKFNELNKTLTLSIFLILSLIYIGYLVLYVPFLEDLKDDSYDQGFNEAKIKIAEEQYSTGNIWVSFQGNLSKMNIREICGGEQ